MNCATVVSMLLKAISSEITDTYIPSNQMPFTIIDLSRQCFVSYNHEIILKYQLFPMS